MSRLTHIRIFTLLLTWGLIAPGLADAYIEPGMVAILWQVLLGALVGASFFFHKIRFAITRLFHWLISFSQKNKPAEKTTPHEPDNPSE